MSPQWTGETLTAPVPDFDVLTTVRVRYFDAVCTSFSDIDEEEEEEEEGEDEVAEDEELEAEDDLHTTTVRGLCDESRTKSHSLNQDSLRHPKAL